MPPFLSRELADLACDAAIEINQKKRGQDLLYNGERIDSLTSVLTDHLVEFNGVAREQSTYLDLNNPVIRTIQAFYKVDKKEYKGKSKSLMLFADDMAAGLDLILDRLNLFRTFSTSEQLTSSDFENLIRFCCKLNDYALAERKPLKRYQLETASSH